MAACVALQSSAYPFSMQDQPAHDGHAYQPAGGVEKSSVSGFPPLHDIGTAGMQGCQVTPDGFLHGTVLDGFDS